MSERKDMMQDMTEAYVLGGLEEAEMAEYEAYLQQDIDERLRVAALRDTVGLLASTAAPVSPPAGMKSRILANVLKGSESTSDTSKGTTDTTVGQPIEQPKPADVSGEPAKRQGEIETGGAAQSGNPRLEDGGAELLLEQARQGIEADESRRAAEALGKAAEDANEKAPRLSETRGGSAGGFAGTQSGESPSGAAEVRGRDAGIENVRQAREASRARGGRALWAGVAAVMAAAAVLLGVYSAQLRGELNDMHTDMTAMQQQLNSVKEPAVGAEVDRTVALAGSEDDPQAWGTASMVRDDTGTHLLVQAAELPELSGSEAYQVWLIDKDGKPVNAGTFMSDSGSGALSYTMQPGDYQMVAITLEPDAEGDQPRGRKVLVGALNG